MPEILRMPEVAANATEALLAEWTVSVGAEFAIGDTLVTIETEKAVVDVEAEATGVILRRLVDAGHSVNVGDPIAVLGRVGESVPDLDAFLAGLGQARPERVFASPLARRLAREARVDVNSLTGSGPAGRIRRADVLAAIADSARPKVIESAPASAAASPDPAVTDQVDYVDIPNTPMRRAIAARLTDSKRSAPHFYLRGSAQVDRLLALRLEINSGSEPKVSVNDVIVKAAACAHVLVPELNVCWMGDAIRQFSRVDIAVAISSDHGLVTPVIQGVDRLSLREVARATSSLVSRAKERRLTQSELEGGSITITNLGMFGTEEFAAILNPPQSAILAVGAARPEPIVIDGSIQVATVLRVTLSVDHRPVDGTVAARWMKAFLTLLENPVQILAS